MNDVRPPISTGARTMRRFAPVKLVALVGGKADSLRAAVIRLAQGVSSKVGVLVDSDFPPEGLPASVVAERMIAGCPCCVGSVSFQVFLVRIIRDHQPDMVLVEVPKEEHLEALEKLLQTEAFARIVREFVIERL